MDQRVQVGGQGGRVPLAGGLPDPGAQGLGDRGEAQGEGLGRLGGSFHEAGDRRVGGDGAEQFRAVAQGVEVRDVFASVGEHHGQGSEDPARAVGGRLGDEVGQPVFAQGAEAGRVQE